MVYDRYEIAQMRELALTKAVEFVRGSKSGFTAEETADIAGCFYEFLTNTNKDAK